MLFWPDTLAIDDNDMYQDVDHMPECVLSTRQLCKTNVYITSFFIMCRGGIISFHKLNYYYNYYENVA